MLRAPTPVSITAEPSELSSAASRLRSYSADHAQITSELQSLLESLSGSWKGQDATAFDGRCRFALNNLKDIASCYQEYAQFLEGAASQYNSAQSKLTQAAKSLPEG